MVWSFHDLWPITGHCTQFENIGCEKWKTTCHNCPQLGDYPKSLFFDRSTRNHTTKKRLFTQRSQLQLVTSSEWSKKKIAESFLSEFPVEVIANGINTELFYPMPTQGKRKELHLEQAYILLGVAGVWTNTKGLADFLTLSTLLKPDQILILIGLSKKQLVGLPKNIIGLERTANIQELATYYTMADVFLNLTYADTFPTTNLEALGCGTPVITYNTGGSIESVFEHAGKIVEKGDLNGVLDAIASLSQRDSAFYKQTCSALAKAHYHHRTQFDQYRHVYDRLLREVGHATA
ncbi:MAG: glycosyltransferase [Maribacter sp.]